jgi:hypothetical protein
VRGFLSLQVTEEGKQERHLVVSAGNYTVVWDFDIVKDNRHDCYRYLFQYNLAGFQTIGA